MGKDIDQFASLLHKHIQGTLTSVEKEALDICVNESEPNRHFFNKIKNEEIFFKELETYCGIDPDAGWNKLNDRVNGNNGNNLNNDGIETIFISILVITALVYRLLLNTPTENTKKASEVPALNYTFGYTPVQSIDHQHVRLLSLLPRLINTPGSVINIKMDPIPVDGSLK
jgi:hypothetical protein